MSPKGFPPIAQGCGTPLPWVTVSVEDDLIVFPTPKGLRHRKQFLPSLLLILASLQAQPRWGWGSHRDTSSQGSRVRQPWAEGHDPVGIGLPSINEDNDFVRRLHARRHHTSGHPARRQHARGHHRDITCADITRADIPRADYSVTNFRLKTGLQTSMTV